MLLKELSLSSYCAFNSPPSARCTNPMGNSRSLSPSHIRPSAYLSAFPISSSYPHFPSHAPGDKDFFAATADGVFGRLLSGTTIQRLLCDGERTIKASNCDNDSDRLRMSTLKVNGQHTIREKSITLLITKRRARCTRTRRHGIEL